MSGYSNEISDAMGFAPGRRKQNDECSKKGVNVKSGQRRKLDQERFRAKSSAGDEKERRKS